MSDELEQFIAWLYKRHACPSGIVWAKQQPDLETLWNNLDRGDWALWVTGKCCETEADKKRLVLAACECARQSLRYVRDGEDRPRIAIEIAEKWCRDDASIEEVRKAATAADAYAADADAEAAAAVTTAAHAAAHAAAYAAHAAANAAANAAAHAAELADTANNAAYAAVTAAYAAHAAAYAAHAAAAEKESLAHSAEIVRKHYPVIPWKADNKN